MLMVKTLMETVVVVNRATQLFRAIKFCSSELEGVSVGRAERDEGRIDCPLEKNSKHWQTFER